MIVELYTFVDLYRRALITADHLLKRGVEHAGVQGVSPAEMLDWRLIDDMHPLGFQIMVVVNIAQQWPARAAGLPVPEAIGPDLSVDEFHQAIAAARSYLKALTPEQFRGRDQLPLTFEIGEGMEPTLPVGRWLAVFATTNLSFHLSTAYGILRARGVPLGKVDLFAGGL